MEREKIIEKIFQQARKDLYYPPIVKVGIADVKTSKIDFSGRNYRIFISREITKRLSNKALLGIFHHELNHWAKHPFDVKTIILEDYFLGEIPNKNAIRNLYDDIVVNLDLLINKGLNGIATTYRELPATTGIDRLLRAFYRGVTDIDFGEVRLEDKLETRLSKLYEIDFLNTNSLRLRTNIKRFAEIIVDLDVEEESLIPFCFFSMKNFTPNEVARAMRHIAEEYNPREYREIAKKVLRRLKEAGISPGVVPLLRDLEKPDIIWYKTRARRYAIYIERLSKKDSLYPYELKDFEMDDIIDNFSPIESYGKVLPGLAKKYHMEGFEGYGELIIPDAVILMDSSGSMRHPDMELSYAVLGAFSIARNYLEHGSRVGVVNFSDENLELEPTVERGKVYEKLKIYQGGGTTLHVSQFKRYLLRVAHRPEEIDFILITDAGIENINGVIDCLSEFKARLTTIWIKSDVRGHEGFEKGYRLLKDKLPPTVTFVEIEDEKDIPRIAVGKSFGVYAGH
jgi:hypothetical protein